MKPVKRWGHIAGICNRALRSSKSKKEEEKVQKIIQQHLRPKNIENLQLPKVDSQLWLQLNRDVKRVDYIQQQTVATYGQAMVPLIKVMEAAEKQDKRSTYLSWYQMLSRFSPGTSNKPT